MTYDEEVQGLLTDFAEYYEIKLSKVNEWYDALIEDPRFDEDHLGEYIEDMCGQYNSLFVDKQNGKYAKNKATLKTDELVRRAIEHVHRVEILEGPAHLEDDYSEESDCGRHYKATTRVINVKTKYSKSTKKNNNN